MVVARILLSRFGIRPHDPEFADPRERERLAAALKQVYARVIRRTTPLLFERSSATRDRT